IRSAAESQDWHRKTLRSGASYCRVKPNTCPIKSVRMMETHLLEITHSKYVSGYMIRLVFNDATERLMDFEPFLRKARNPDLTQYRQSLENEDFSNDVSEAWRKEIIRRRKDFRDG